MPSRSPYAELLLTSGIVLIGFECILRDKESVILASFEEDEGCVICCKSLSSVLYSPFCSVAAAPSVSSHCMYDSSRFEHIDMSPYSAFGRFSTLLDISD